MRSELPVASKVRGALAGLAVAVALVLAGCADGAGGGAGGTAASDAPEAQYPTESAHFGALQAAALSADYTGFAGHLGVDDTQPIVQTLTERFAGKPFDVFTEAVETGATAHRRLVELRTTSGRLYLFVELGRAGDGWNISTHELTPRRARAQSRMRAITTPTG